MIGYSVKKYIQKNIPKYYIKLKQTIIFSVLDIPVYYVFIVESYKPSDKRILYFIFLSFYALNLRKHITGDEFIRLHPCLTIIVFRKSEFS